MNDYNFDKCLFFKSYFHFFQGNSKLKIISTKFSKFLNNIIFYSNNNYEYLIYNNRPSILGTNIIIIECIFNLCTTSNSNGGGAIYLNSNSITLNISS